MCRWRPKSQAVKLSNSNSTLTISIDNTAPFRCLWFSSSMYLIWHFPVCLCCVCLCLWVDACVCLCDCLCVVDWALNNNYLSVCVCLCVCVYV